MIRNGAFLGYSKQCSWSLSCWEKFKSKGAKWFVLALFETMFWKLEQLRRFESNGNRWCILRLFEMMFWQFTTAWTKLKARGLLNGALWRYFKQCFGIWNCREKVERMYALWCNLALLEAKFFKLVMLRRIWKQGGGGKWCILTLFKGMFWKLYLIFLKNRRLIGPFLF